MCSTQNKIDLSVNPALEVTQYMRPMQKRLINRYIKEIVTKSQQSPHNICHIKSSSRSKKMFWNLLSVLLLIVVLNAQQTPAHPPRGSHEGNFDEQDGCGYEHHQRGCHHPHHRLGAHHLHHFEHLPGQFPVHSPNYGNKFPINSQEMGAGTNSFGNQNGRNGHSGINFQQPSREVQPSRPFPTPSLYNNNVGQSGFQANFGGRSGAEHGQSGGLNPNYNAPENPVLSDNAANTNFDDIFKTNDFVSPALHETRSSLDHKGEDVTPESINDRNLFETAPICTGGMELRGGRCRKAV